MMEPSAASSRESLARDLLALARPRHWVKAVFILLPIPFAVAGGATADFHSLVAGILGFCLVSSGVYVLNDVCDAARDALHPEKRLRPIAAKRVSRGLAAGYAGVLLLVGFALIGATGLRDAVVVSAIYLAVNVVYSLGIKNVPLVDVFVLASGFFLRVLLGCALVSAAPSRWLLLCASSLALFLAFAKRRGDVVAEVERAHRPSLAGYNEAYLGQAMALTAGVALLSYGLYCQEAPNLVAGREFASLPFAVFGILEYLRIAIVKGRGGSPVDVVLESPSLFACGVGWLIGVLWSLGVI